MLKKIMKHWELKELQKARGHNKKIFIHFVT